jgi:hypothetical protein
MCRLLIVIMTVSISFCKNLWNVNKYNTIQYEELGAMLQSSMMVHKNLETSKVDDKCQYDCYVHV